MQLIFTTQLRGVCKVNESKNRNNIMAVSIAIVVLGLGLRANCSLTTSKQRKKTGPSWRNLSSLGINVTQIGWRSMQQKLSILEFLYTDFWSSASC